MDQQTPCGFALSVAMLAVAATSGDMLTGNLDLVLCSFQIFKLIIKYL